VQQKFALPPTESISSPQGWDISVYQGEPAFPSSLKFVYNQVGDGASYRDPNFSVNCAREKARGIKCGAYLFVRPGDASGQAAVLRSVLSQANLPPALDVEVSGSYEELCPIARDLGVPTIAYTAPGLWPGGATCGTKLWAAEWGTGGYTFGEWGSYVLQQTCGTCSIDVDVDHGLLAKAGPSRAETLAREHRELDAHYRLRAELHALIEKHTCRHGEHAKPRSYHTVCGLWLAHGQREIRLIDSLHRKGIY
jgi:hypothetical protein